MTYLDTSLVFDYLLASFIQIFLDNVGKVSYHLPYTSFALIYSPIHSPHSLRMYVTVTHQTPFIDTPLSSK